MRHDNFFAEVDLIDKFIRDINTLLEYLVNDFHLGKSIKELCLKYRNKDILFPYEDKWCDLDKYRFVQEINVLATAVIPCENLGYAIRNVLCKKERYIGL